MDEICAESPQTEIRSSVRRVETKSRYQVYLRGKVRGDFRVSSGNRRVIIQDLLEYTYNYTRTESFKKEYSKLKTENKPLPFLISTPEELRSEMIESYRKSIMEMEAAVAKTDGSTKAIFEKVVADSK